MRDGNYHTTPDGGLRYKPETKCRSSTLDTIHAFYTDGMIITRTASLLTACWLVIEGAAMVIALVRDRIVRKRSKK